MFLKAALGLSPLAYVYAESLTSAPVPLALIGFFLFGQSTWQAECDRDGWGGVESLSHLSQCSLKHPPRPVWRPAHGCKDPTLTISRLVVNCKVSLLPLVLVFKDKVYW